METACGRELGAVPPSPGPQVLSRLPLSAVPIPADPSTWTVIPALVIPAPWPRSPLPILGLFPAELPNGFLSPVPSPAHPFLASTLSLPTLVFNR